MNGTLAPIGVSAYTRLSHLKKTLSSLRKNTLAAQSRLYIFSDGAKPGDEEKVRDVRRYLRSVTGFKNKTIIERANNHHIQNNFMARAFLLKEYGRLIWLAEDIETAPGFLAYMNQALTTYADRPDIINISGYLEPFEVPQDYAGDALALGRYNAWGIGLWADKYQKMLDYFGRPQARQDIQNPDFTEKLTANGNDILAMLKRELNDDLDALDVRTMYLQAKHNWLTIKPRQSLVQNNGHDGTGINCGTSDRFLHKELWQKTSGFSMDKAVQPDSSIIALNKQFRG